MQFRFDRHDQLFDAGLYFHAWAVPIPLQSWEFWAANPALTTYINFYAYLAGFSSLKLIHRWVSCSYEGGSESNRHVP